MYHPLLADPSTLKDSELENKIMDELKRKGIKSWIRYVDDTLVII